MIPVLSTIGYLLFAPLLGGLLDGLDRVISARMQGRRGPKLLQPFYDVGKLFCKQLLTVNGVQILLILSYLAFVIFSGCLFFSGMDLLMCFFALTTAAMFLVLAAASTSSPFSDMGSQRELLQMMAYEPMILLAAVGFYLATGSFRVSEIIASDTFAIPLLPGVLVGFLYIMTIKIRKSPFDLSASHHAHQEMVRGITVEIVGPLYGAVTIAEWYENILLLGVVALFFLGGAWWSWILALACVFVAYFLEILIDNTSARMRWDTILRSTWIVTLLAGGLNILILMLF